VLEEVVEFETEKSIYSLHIQMDSSFDEHFKKELRRKSLLMMNGLNQQQKVEKKKKK
jgi:hypothetical protein